MSVIVLIPEMVSLFNEFMSEYGKKAKELPNNPEEMMKLHTEMIGVYAVKAVQLAVKNLDDTKKEIDWDNWLKGHGVGKN